MTPRLYAVSMNILIVGEEFLPDAVNGAARVCYQTARLLVARGHAVTVFVKRRKDPTPRHELIDGISVYRYGSVAMLGSPFRILLALAGAVRSLRSNCSRNDCRRAGWCSRLTT